MEHYRLFKRSVNGEKFAKYIRELKKRHGRTPMALYMDNLPVHTSTEAKALYEELNIQPIFAAPYSPDYNPIEFVFGILKSKVRKWRTEDILKRKRRLYTDLVPRAISEVKFDSVKNCILHVY